MPEAIISDGGIPLLLLAGLCYLVLIQYLSKKESKPRKLSEAEMLAKLARMGPETEYDIFHTAAEEWNVPSSRVEEDFKDYLLEEVIPYYVNSHMRKRAREAGDGYRPPFLVGGGSMPWLK